MVLSGRLHPSTPPRDWVHLRLVTGQNTRLLRTRQIGHGTTWHGALGFCAYFLFLPLPATSLGSPFGQQPLSIQATTPSAQLPPTESARAYAQLLLRVQKNFQKIFCRTNAHGPAARSEARVVPPLAQALHMLLTVRSRNTQAHLSPENRSHILCCQICRYTSCARLALSSGEYGGSGSV